MSKRNRNDRNGLLWGNDTYWATGAYNTRLFQMYRQQIMELALVRFEWVNLPASCDERYLEWTLLTQGIATIAYPRKQPGVFYSTQVAYASPLNVYDNPTRWKSIGNNGWRFDVTPSRGVLVWDNRYRVPIIDWVDIWARELVDIMRTMQMNRMHQKIPYIFKGPQEKKFDMQNLYQQVAGGEPAVIATNGIETIDMDVLSTGVPFIGNDLYSAWQNQWNTIYQGLGIDNLPFKQERQIEDEVKSQTMPTQLMALNPLEARREACDRLNRRFPELFPEPIDVVWRQDNTSQNYNYLHNIQERMEDDSTDAETTME